MTVVSRAAKFVGSPLHQSHTPASYVAWRTADELLIGFPDGSTAALKVSEVLDVDQKSRALTDMLSAIEDAAFAIAEMRSQVLHIVAGEQAEDKQPPVEKIKEGKDG